MPTPVNPAVIGGSGLYAMPGLTEMREYDIDTHFGKPSAPIVVGRLENRSIAFLARHGIGHHITPSEVNYRANIHALKSPGVETLKRNTHCSSKNISSKSP
jgi:5'-methylthioadenosine phosphorylase